jgi:hypothetical protein
MKRILLLGTCLLAVLAFSAAHAATQEQKCEATKNKLAGAYMACRQAAYAKALLKEAGPDFSKCAAHFTSAWLKAEAKAAAKGSFCPTQGDVTEFQQAIDELTAGFAMTLAGALPCTAEVGGFCWFLGDAGADCESTCVAQGRTYDDPGTAGYAGSSGTNEQCLAVLTALGATQALAADAVSCGMGLGCHVDGALQPHRCTDLTTAAAAGANVGRACACQ